MNEYIQGALVGGLCGFIYWMFNLMEKRFESKLDSVAGDIERIENELQEDRKIKDYLYNFVINNVKK